MSVVIAPQLSDFERQVAALISEGLTDRQIAERLGRNQDTVRSCAIRARRKAGVANRRQLVAWMVRQGSAAEAAERLTEIKALAMGLRSTGLDESQVRLLDRLVDLAAAQGGSL